MEQERWLEAIKLASRLDQEAHETRVYELWGYAAASEAKSLDRIELWSGAFGIHERAIKDHRSSATILNNAAYCLTRLGWTKEGALRAETCLLSAVKEDPQLSQVWHNLLRLQPYLAGSGVHPPDMEVAWNAVEVCEPSPALRADVAHVLGAACLVEPDPVRKEQLRNDFRAHLEMLIAEGEFPTGALFQVANRVFPGEFQLPAKLPAARQQVALLVTPVRSVRH